MKYNNVPFNNVQDSGWVQTTGVPCGQGMLSGVEEVIINPEGVEEPEDGGKGPWPSGQ